MVAQAFLASGQSLGPWAAKDEPFFQMCPISQGFHEVFVQSKDVTLKGFHCSIESQKNKSMEPLQDFSSCFINYKLSTIIIFNVIWL